MQIYFETDYIIIGYDKEHSVIVARWIVPPTSAELREGSNKVIPAMNHFNTGKVIWDTCHLGTLHPDDQQWAATEFYINALKAGYSRTAIIIPQDIFTQISVEATMEQVSEFSSAYFNNKESALAWINSTEF